MARESVAKTKRNIMAQEKPRHLRKVSSTLPSGNITQPQSLLNVSELETRTKATVKDINELYTALQGLVPKKTAHTPRAKHKRSRSGASGTDTDKDKSSDDLDGPRLRRRCHSEKFTKRNFQFQKDENLNYVAEKITPQKQGAQERQDFENQVTQQQAIETHVIEKQAVEKQTIEKPVLSQTLSNERLFASDTEAELSQTSPEHRLQRQFSLPTYEEESANETSNEIDGAHKRSRFLPFRRRHRAKQNKKPNSSSWRSFFSTLSLKRKQKKHAKNKMASGIPKSKTDDNIKRTPKNKAKKNASVPLEERSPKVVPRLSFNLVDERNNVVRQSGKKRAAPEPPLSADNPDDIPQLDGRKNTMETKSDAVQKKLSIWYKHAVKETNSNTLKEPVRATRSYENLLTDTEIIRKRGTFTSDTESASGSDGTRGSKTNKTQKTKVRKTRARRNRRREERARFHSLPNVKLVTRALNETKKTSPQSRVPADDSTKDELTDDVRNITITTVKPVEAKISFGSTLEKDEAVDLKLQKDSGRNLLNRQCSKTASGYIRSLQLNLFYSESPSRETVHRSRSTLRRPRAEGSESVGNPHEFAFKIRRSSSRRRKRRSFKRGQTRLPHQSPFYVPPNNINLSPKSTTRKNLTKSKDSGLGSPDPTNDNWCATFPVTKRDQRISKPYSESDDSGWASSHRRLASTTDEAIQTDPVIVMTAVSRVRRPVLSHEIKNDKSQSEA